jgi:hypothetical protein
MFAIFGIITVVLIIVLAVLAPAIRLAKTFHRNGIIPVARLVVKLVNAWYEDLLAAIRS